MRFRITREALFIWTVMIQIVSVNGFSPYFLIEKTGMTQLQAVDFCRSIGMQLIKFNNKDINMMATQFAMNEGITNELLWISLFCNPANGLCRWLDGDVLTWADWTSTEPVYECTVLIGSTNWRTRKCGDLYFPFCYAPPHPSFEIISGSFNFVEASMNCINIGGQLAVVSNPLATLRLQSEFGGMQFTYAWIGLYGNGKHLVWQNMREAVTYSNWIPGIIDPEFGDDIAVGINMIDFTWKPISKNDTLNYVLCQHNYLPIEDNIDYDTSRQKCEMYAWDLALLRTDEETKMAHLAIQHDALMSVTNNFWIGLQWDGTTFIWNDGTSLGFSNWMPGALLAGSTSPLVVEMVPTSSLQWNTKPNTMNDLNSYICQFPTRNIYPITRHLENDDNLINSGQTTQSPIQSNNKFIPYFLIERKVMSQLQAVDFCQSIGMQLIKINNKEIDTMATQFAIEEGITNELLWISLFCNPSNGLCRWLDGQVLNWADWASTEPLYECTVLVGGTNWQTRKCGDLYFPFCYATKQPSFEIISGSFNFVDASMQCIRIGGQLAVVSNPVTTLRLQSEYSGMQIDYAWIGLYGNGTHLVWQNMRKPVTYSNWVPGVIDPAFGDDIAVGINMIDFTWKPIAKTETLNHVLCQHNYLPIEDNCDYDTSRRKCEMYAWDLALLRTKEETEIAHLVIQHYALAAITNNFWIGLQWDGKNFIWNDGTPLGFSNWMPGALMDGSTSLQVVEMVTNSYLQWNSKPKTMNELNSYICQFPTRNIYPISRHMEKGGDDAINIEQTTQSSVQSTDSTIAINFMSTQPVSTIHTTDIATIQLTDSTIKTTIVTHTQKTDSTVKTSDITTTQFTDTTIKTSDITTTQLADSTIKTTDITTTQLADSTIKTTDITTTKSVDSTIKTTDITTSLSGESTVKTPDITTTDSNYSTLTTTDITSKQSVDITIKPSDITSIEPTDSTMKITDTTTTELGDSTTTNVIISESTERTVAMHVSSDITGLSTESFLPGSTIPTLIYSGYNLIERKFQSKNNFQPSASPHQVISSPSKEHCAAICITDNLICSVFVYDTGLCLLYDNYQSNNVLQSVGSVIWT